MTPITRAAKVAAAKRTASQVSVLSPFPPVRYPNKPVIRFSAASPRPAR